MNMKSSAKFVAFPALGILIFALGLVIGGMFIKIQYLEGKVTGAAVPTAAPTAAPSGQQAPTAPTKVAIKVTSDDPVRGDPKAKLTIVNFSDYQCPFCERFYKDTEKQLIKEYVDTGKAKFVFKQLPLGSLHENALSAANASLCAKEQNKFWEYHDKLFDVQGSGSTDALAPLNLKKYAADLGLNTGQFDDCLDKQKYNSQVQADIAEANRNGFQSTPSTAVGTTPLVGAMPYAQFKTAIDAELAK